MSIGEFPIMEDTLSHHFTSYT